MTEGKNGLWVFGPMALVDTNRAIAEYVDSGEWHARKPGQAERRTAAWVERRVREQWKLDGLLRANGGDLPLWLDANESEQKLERFWKADHLWVMDLWQDYDNTFVQKNLLLPLQEAMGAGKTVFVTGDCPPSHFDERWERAILATYNVVELT